MCVSLSGWDELRTTKHVLNVKITQWAILCIWKVHAVFDWFMLWPSVTWWRISCHEIDNYAFLRFWWNQEQDMSAVWYRSFLIHTKIGAFDSQATLCSSFLVSASCHDIYTCVVFTVYCDGYWLIWRNVIGLFSSFFHLGLKVVIEKYY